ncbi:MAG: type I 3-dehydroquinate dehydratase [Gemmataceae bacterium]|nr:type I 3-dehydroquinate dehydratase [Gemmataceae bacterium]
MICITINQESRRLALADMLNAGRFGDLLEVRLDRFGKAPDLGELMTAKQKPIIMTCRRGADGGQWDDSEAERLAILRQCIISKSDYVDIELDVADDIRPFPGAKRVISYVNLEETPEDIQAIYDECRNKKPDVVKLVTKTRTPEEAWPLVQIVAKATVPTVVMGLGKAATMLAILGQKIGAPWTYAALERGMEAYPGQPTVDDLLDVWQFRSIDKSTRFVGIVGQGPREIMTAAALNAHFVEIGVSLRCLPLEVGSLKVFRKLIDIVKMVAVVVDDANQARMMEFAPEMHGVAKSTSTIDLLVHKDETLHGFHAEGQAALAAFQSVMAKKYGGEHPMKGRQIVIVGVNAAARLIAEEAVKQGGSPILASQDKKKGGELAKQLGCRFIGLEAVYSTMHDVVVFASDESTEARNCTLKPGYLKPGMVVMDLTGSLTATPFLAGAQDRACEIVPAADLFFDRIGYVAKLLTSKPAARATLEKAIPDRFLD